MSAPQWTRGPWVAVKAALCAKVDVLEIAEISDMRVIPEAGGWPTVGAPEADAHLIAAAPDLYAALEGVLRVADRATAEFEAARAALAKARGEA